jgi:hypothetical protein
VDKGQKEGGGVCWGSVGGLCWGVCVERGGGERNQKSFLAIRRVVGNKFHVSY